MGGVLIANLSLNAFFGSVHGAFTCDEQDVLNPGNSCYQGTPSDDSFLPAVYRRRPTLGASFSGGTVRPYLGGGYARLMPKFQVNFTNRLGILDASRVESTLNAAALFGGGAHMGACPPLVSDGPVLHAGFLRQQHQPHDPRCTREARHMTRTTGLMLAALLAGGAPPVAAQQPIPTGTVTEGTLSFDGKATAGDFSGTTHTVSGSMTGGPALADVRGFVEVPVNTLVTDNDKRDKDLNKSMQSDEYPTIRFELKTVQVKAERGDSADVVLGGDFIIRGVTQAVELPAVVLRHGESITVVSSFPLNLKDYKIGGLSKFLGLFKMNEHIAVHVHVAFGFTPP
jgi:polyisoprenoid-binding protein YceI